MAQDTDSICAIATSAGRSGIGIIRISGSITSTICNQLLGFTPTNRYAHYCKFLGPDEETIDQGLAIYFQAPNSFTGEDVLELHGHGGTYILNELLGRVIALGARQAEPGEFSKRAFLNNKIDLVQAEAIADLIDANSRKAARSAMRTLQGDFSRQIVALVEKLIATRVNVEAAIDFTDEDIDVLSDTKVVEFLQSILDQLNTTYSHARQGALLKEGLRVVIAGKPNAGKSSLLNALSGQDSAIVSDVPGTTRDVLSEQINIDGMPVHIIDTAGLRRSDDVVEREGVRRAQAAIDLADQILLVVDYAEAEQAVEKLLEPLGLLNSSDTNSDLTSDDSNRILAVLQHTTLIFNKIDLHTGVLPEVGLLVFEGTELRKINISAKQKLGLDLLRDQLKSSIGYDSNEEGVFVARKRHLTSLNKAETLISTALAQLQRRAPLELVAEDLRLAQKELGKITGDFTNDDLLGEIFSTFCVGK